jgi:PPOX class probable F420-dependent enzyme
MELDQALAFVRDHRHGILVTVRRDTRPQLSNILYGVTADGVVRISITADRAKYHNLVREPWAALHVSRDDFYAYVVLEGEASTSAVAAATDDAAVEELVDLYRSLAGEHPDWDEFRAAMVAERRVVARLRPERAYGMLQLPRPSRS